MTKTRKQLALAAAMLCALLLLVGCGTMSRDESATLQEVGDRFEKVSTFAGTYIIIDNETGVQYLYVQHEYGGGLTVLVDADGKPMLKEGRE